MKITQVPLTYKVIYFGQELQIPIGHKCLATDRDGNVYSYTHRPDRGAGSFVRKTGEAALVATADLYEANLGWQSSLFIVISTS